MTEIEVEIEILSDKNLEEIHFWKIVGTQETHWYVRYFYTGQEPIIGVHDEPEGPKAIYDDYVAEGWSEGFVDDIESVLGKVQDIKVLFPPKVNDET